MFLSGCIGEIRDGYDFRFVLSLIFAEGSVDELLNGHSYARAVRALISLKQALSLLFFDELKDDSVELKKLILSEDNLTYDMKDSMSYLKLILKKSKKEEETPN